jgi:hypothetical protein
MGLLRGSTLITKTWSWSNTLPPYGNNVRSIEVLAAEL